MKTRNGFVSNSSSSSFVILSPHKIESKEDVKRACFFTGDQYTDGIDTWTADEVVDLLWEQIENPDYSAVEDMLDYLQVDINKDSRFQEYIAKRDNIWEEYHILTDFVYAYETMFSMDYDQDTHRRMYYRKEQEHIEIVKAMYIHNQVKSGWLYVWRLGNEMDGPCDLQCALRARPPFRYPTVYSKEH